jgi:hypothetical protein
VRGNVSLQTYSYVKTRQYALRWSEGPAQECTNNIIPWTSQPGKAVGSEEDEVLSVALKEGLGWA